MSSVVVCTYDRYNLLDGAIESLLRQTLANFKIIVVDNFAGVQKHVRRMLQQGASRISCSLCQSVPTRET
ncbi:glycosyltransferase family 2 protein [Hyphomicrobium sp. DY-1]|uniref:glycosyltransferase family 2 protein n=1 Tax=Hyphomicrobium sp. DY-1 TaxID=3075650 RepID=UPI0039C2A134